MAKKAIVYISGAIAAALILTVGGGYLLAVLRPGAENFPETAEISVKDGKTAPGTTVDYHFSAELPVNYRIKSVLADGENIAGGEAESRIASYLPTRMEWEISGSFRPLKPGEYQQLKVLVTAEKTGGKDVAFEVKIPDFTCGLPENAIRSEELAPAPEAVVQAADEEVFYRQKSFWLISAAAIIVIAAIAGYILVKRQKKAAIRLDERCIDSIRKVLTEVTGKRISPEKGWEKLCDTVREFTGEFFQVPATTRTTVEFLNDFASMESSAPAGYRIFITSFMKNADMIKFAGEKSGETFFEDAAYQAISMIKLAVSSREGEEK